MKISEYYELDTTFPLEDNAEYITNIMIGHWKHSDDPVCESCWRMSYAQILLKLIQEK